MFERRLKNILIALTLALTVITLRLVDLQVVSAEYFREKARTALLRPARNLPFVRGRITDRFGAILANDEPSWQISVDYDVLAGQFEPATDDERRKLAACWADLANYANLPIEEIQQRRDRIVRRVQIWHDVVSRNQGYEVTIREERVPHPIITDLDDQQHVDARKRFADYEWITIENAHRRRYNPNPSIAHLVGRLGAVSEKDIKTDPHADDPLRRYRPTDRKGITGVERAAEQTLRGACGRLQKNLRAELVQNIPAVNGQDVALTIRLDLQTALYDLLARRVPELCPHPAGAAAVVLHVPSREILALVSYPGYDANEFKRAYNHLRSDTRFTPLRFRALANAYEPGSIVKPLTCLAGLASNVIDTHTTFHCDGHYLPNVPNAWRCWPIAGTNRRMHHGDVDAAAALAGSCNIFMYSVADRLGVNRLTNFFDMVGFGRSTGIGLIEERIGTNPTPEWLMRVKNAPATLGRARNFAIGQGELTITPIQAANLMAAYASGRWQTLTLFMNDFDRPVWKLPGTKQAWLAIRSGLFRVVNDAHGTAHRTAFWKNPDYALSGKTGSATTPEAPTHYQIQFLDRRGTPQSTIIPAKTRRQALEDFRRSNPDARTDLELDVAPYAWFPPKRRPDDPKYAHAWFIGYLQPIDPAGRPLLDRTPPIAFAILVEFGGSGGYTTGPIARDLSDLLIQHLGSDLDPDHPFPATTEAIQPTS